MPRITQFKGQMPAFGADTSAEVVTATAEEFAEKWIDAAAEAWKSSHAPPVRHYGILQIAAQRA